jgi:hypothetical protein
MKKTKKINKIKDKAIIFDSGTLISFSMNGLLDEIKSLKKIFNGYFLITNEVKKEIIDKPLNIKRFELEALKLKQLLDEEILSLPTFLDINEKEISQNTEKILEVANNIFEDTQNKKKGIKIISSGEASCLVLSDILTEKKIKNVISIDERTTRSLCENPEKLHNFLEKKFHVKLIVNKHLLKNFQKYKFIRSAELVYVSYKKGISTIKGNEALDALLWAMKFKGCAISVDEINEIKKIK